MIAGTTTIVRSLGGNAASQVELRQLTGRHVRGDQQVQQVDRQLADRQKHATA